MTLEEAQLEKYRRIAEVTGLEPGMRVLEIGSGWGGFAVYAAEEIGCQVTTITVSKEQAAWVERLVARARAHATSITVRLEDFARHDGFVRRGRVDRDDRVDPLVALARVLPRRARSTRTGRQGRSADHHRRRSALGILGCEP